MLLAEVERHQLDPIASEVGPEGELIVRVTPREFERVAGTAKRELVAFTDRARGLVQVTIGALQVRTNVPRDRALQMTGAEGEP